MKLELKNIKHTAWASEETNCYQASVYLDGKPLAIVDNAGRGGCDRQDEHPSFKKENFRKSFFDVMKDVDAYFKGLPKKQYTNFELDMDLELWCGEQLEKWQYSKDLKRHLKKGSMIKDGEDVYTWKRHLNSEVLMKHHPKAIIMNDLPFDEALSLYMGEGYGMVEHKGEVS